MLFCCFVHYYLFVLKLLPQDLFKRHPHWVLFVLILL